MAKRRKTGDKPERVIPWSQIIISALLAGILSAQIIIIGSLSRVEERTQGIEYIKQGVYKMMGKFGIAEITPNFGGSISGNNVQVYIPPNSVTEPTYFSLDKISSSNLPAALPNNKYQYTDGIILSSIGDNVTASAQVKWDLASFGSDCIDAKIFYWNTANYKWQEVTTQTCTPSGIVGFQAETGYLYILTKEK